MFEVREGVLKKGGKEEGGEPTGLSPLFWRRKTLGKEGGVSTPH